MQTKVKIEWFSPFGAIADKAIECAENFFGLSIEYTAKDSVH